MEKILILIATILGLYSQPKVAPVPSTMSPEPVTVEAALKYSEPRVWQTASDTITLMVTGDIIPARAVNAKVVRLGNFNFPFEKTADFLKSADIVFANIESPLIAGCPVTVEGMVFCGDQRNVTGLVYANVKVATLANNHSGNFGTEAVQSTTNLLNKNGIQVTPTILTIKNKKFGFLGYNDIGNVIDENEIKTDVLTLKKQADFVIVAFHWGTEYTVTPTERQKLLAHTTIDAGADLIAGNHPHWVQAIEIYNHKFITYAHGNFVFDQMWSRETREGVIGKYIFGKNGLEKVSFYPIIIEDYSQPRFAAEKEATPILERMRQASR